MTYIHDPITDKIVEYYEHEQRQDFSRHKSWEHCYGYFWSSRDQPDAKTCTLHLTAYLASWGMYRASAPIFKKDYMIHEDIVEIILQPQYQILRGLEIDGFERNSKILYGLIEKIFDYYKGKFDNSNPSETLITKILMGTLGCTPAFDIHFNRGFKEPYKSRKSEITPSDKKLVMAIYRKVDRVFQWASNNKRSIVAARDSARLGDISYPDMKLIDMYFWRKGGGKLAG